MNMEYTTRNIGPDHPDYQPKWGKFTQVQVFEDGVILAQFFGHRAKINAGHFISQMKIGKVYIEPSPQSDDDLRLWRIPADDKVFGV